MLVRTLYDIGDGVACVDFHAKMNALDDDIFAIVNEALERLEKDFDGLVVSTQAENFSAGANLFMLVVAAQQGMWDNLDQAIRKLQGLNMRMRYSPKPIVVAPMGLALGGGCEIAMHASRVVASSETYIGLVETGAGVIPAGGGTKEMLRRMINPPMKTENAEVLAVPSTSVPSNRSSQGCDFGGRSTADGDSQSARPHCVESRSFADGSQARSFAHGKCWLSFARA